MPTATRCVDPSLVRRRDIRQNPVEVADSNPPATLKVRIKGHERELLAAILIKDLDYRCTPGVSTDSEDRTTLKVTEKAFVGGVPTDAELLGMWRASPDPALLERLIQRHGALVYGVCRRALGHTPDADDAFQATFLVFVRKAGGLTRPGQLASWLYGVAFRIARRVRFERFKRQQREKKMAAEPPAPMQPDDTTDLRRLLDQELDRLPDKYRLPILLCELEGRTLDEAARELQWPKGTVAGRLSRGRDLLRRRMLRRRGLVLPIFVLGGSALPAAAASPSDHLVSATVSAAGQHGGPVGHPATAIADAAAREEATQQRYYYLIVFLLVVLSFIGWQSVTALGAGFSTAPASSGCHANAP